MIHSIIINLLSWIQFDPYHFSCSKQVSFDHSLRTNKNWILRKNHTFYFLVSIYAANYTLEVYRKLHLETIQHCYKIDVVHKIPWVFLLLSVLISSIPPSKCVLLQNSAWFNNSSYHKDIKLNTLNRNIN